MIEQVYFQKLIHLINQRNKMNYEIENRVTKIHELKTISVFFDMVLTGVKPYEIRKNDRPYNVGDIVILKEVDNDDRNKYTGREINAHITNIVDYEILKRHNIKAIEQNIVILTIAMFHVKGVY